MGVLEFCTALSMFLVSASLNGMVFVQTSTYSYLTTSSAAQGGGGSFKNRQL